MIARHRVAYVISRYTYRSPFIVREIEELAARGWKITVLSLRPPVFEPGSDPAALPYEVRYDSYFALRLLARATLELTRRPKAIADYIRLIASAYRRKPAALVRNLAIVPKAAFYSTIAREQQWRHLHAHWATVSTSTAMLMARLTDLSFSFTGHAWDIFEDTTLLAEKARAARFVVTCTEFNRQYLANVASFPGHKVHVLHHGIPLPARAQVRRQGDGPLRILTVARWSEKKGLLELVRALAVVRDRGVRFAFQLIAGGGSADYERRVRQAITELDLDGQTEMLTWLPHREVMAAMELNDVFVLPSIRKASGDMDGIPNVLVEALAVGLPVIATRLSGIPELVRHGETGLLVNERDIEGIAAAIEWCAMHRQEAQALAAQGRGLVQRMFDIDKTISALEQRFSTAIQAAVAADS